MESTQDHKPKYRSCMAALEAAHHAKRNGDEENRLRAMRDVGHYYGLAGQRQKEACSASQSFSATAGFRRALWESK